MYCPNCGTKNNFVNGVAPKFCTNCGHDLRSLDSFKTEENSSFASVEITSNRGRKKPSPEKGLEGVSIVGASEPLKQTLSTILNKGGRIGRRQETSVSVNGPSKEDILNKFKTEASSIGFKNKNHYNNEIE